MTLPSPPLTLLPCLDSEEMAASCRKNLDIPRKRAEELGSSAVELADIGHYVNPAGERIDWSRLIQSARTAKESIPPGAQLRVPDSPRHTRTRVQVMNTTTLEAARGLDEGGLRPLALNFANGIHPGGGFQRGARAQEEVLYRSSALYSTLAGDPMYAYHRERPLPDSSDWAILSPDVPVFRTDGGEELERPWLLSFLTSAAPFAPTLCQPTSGDLLQKRISRILAIASSTATTPLCSVHGGAAHSATTRREQPWISAGRWKPSSRGTSGMWCSPSPTGRPNESTWGRSPPSFPEKQSAASPDTATATTITDSILHTIHGNRGRSCYE